MVCNSDTVFVLDPINSMENNEELLNALEEFDRSKPMEIPKILDDYLAHVAKTGDPMFQWSRIKYLFRHKLLAVMNDFFEATPIIDLPNSPNIEPFKYDVIRNTIIERLDSFNGAPFTIQRLAELLTAPRREYNRVDKFVRAVEKNILVVSTVDPGYMRRFDQTHALMNGVLDHSSSDPDGSLVTDDMSSDDTGTASAHTTDENDDSEDSIVIKQEEIDIDDSELELDMDMDMSNEQIETSTVYEQVLDGDHDQMNAEAVSGNNLSAMRNSTRIHQTLDDDELRQSAVSEVILRSGVGQIPPYNNSSAPEGSVDIAGASCSGTKIKTEPFDAQDAICVPINTSGSETVYDPSEVPFTQVEVIQYEGVTIQEEIKSKGQEEEDGKDDPVQRGEDAEDEQIEKVEDTEEEGVEVGEDVENDDHRAEDVAEEATTILIKGTVELQKNKEPESEVELKEEKVCICESVACSEKASEPARKRMRTENEPPVDEPSESDSTKNKDTSKSVIEKKN